jgi:LysM repeat protein
VPIQTIASAAGTTYREFKRLNPEFRADDVPAGTRELKLPPGTGKTFEQNFNPSKAMTSTPAASSQPEAEKPAVNAQPPAVQAPPSKPQAKAATPAPAAATYHTVKKGETLFGIAQQYRVNAQALREANNLKGNNVLVGQKLRIPQ